MSQTEKMQVELTQNPIKLEVSGEKGFTEISDYFYLSNQKTFEKNQIAHERTEVTEFSVNNEITNYITEKGWLQLRQKTIQKSGTLDLNDMAFPEVNESIDFVYSSDGYVIKAGDFPTHSIFFVPPIPLPTKAVKVGDTWVYEGEWMDTEQALQLKINIVGVLKNIYRCYEQERCVELEYSGRVEIPEHLQKLASFESRLEASFLLRLKNFSVLKSLIQNHEVMEKDGNRMDVNSCLISKKRTESDNSRLNCQL